jgi:HTH-type transcriptional regulator, sugar sensing transcriptional regulator
MQTEEKIKSVLNSLGITKTESLIYIDLIKNSPSTPLEVSKRTHVYRSNAYESLRRLKGRGFITETKKNNKTIFQAKNPHILKEYYNQRKKDIEEIIPEIQNIANNISSKEIVSVSHGLPRVRASMMEMLEQKKPLFVYNVPSKSQDLLGHNFAHEFHKRRAQYNIPCKVIGIQNSTQLIELNKYPLRELRYLTEDKESDTCTLISGDEVKTIIFENPITIIEIKHQNVADTYKQKFDVLWKAAKTI